ncbi:M90 family metallopeptidase [Marinobacter sp. SS21]|uniref:M90 family metallopeptidase n=1 Tax=Marinobacter sp. SS21 TaxID=2979460 RepID=UPI00232B4A55|nr:M90 family metallopeptidase [Marinobacter sp. SS21]MDC0661050.1 zinc-dependent peptidase [Marinobacter sp. SS21]
MLGYGIALIAIVAISFYGLFIYPQQRAQRIARRPFPEPWQRYLVAHMALYRRLPPERRSRLHRDIQVLLHRATFYGCAGLQLNDTMKVLIAAHGALLVNGLSPDYYPKLRAILVYPGAYRVREQVQDGEILSHSEQDRLGESWHSGRLVLSWDTLSEEAAAEAGHSNVGLHEFAHQLDQLDGASDGAPPLASEAQARHWQTVFSDAWQRRQRQTDRDSIIDEYGTESPAEFFAVVTEAFFLQPLTLAQQEPELYHCLVRFYQLNPDEWPGIPDAAA